MAFWGPNSLIVVYVDPLGFKCLLERPELLSFTTKCGIEFRVILSFFDPYLIMICLVWGIISIPPRPFQVQVA